MKRVDLLEVENILTRLGSVEPFSSVSSQEVSVQPLQTLPHSEVYRVRVASHGASFILKSPGPNDAADLARRERLFYRQIAPELPDGLAPKCVFEKDYGSSGWLLIEDLSETHLPIDDGGTPTEQQSHSFIQALSALHGATYQKRDVLDAWAQAENQLLIGTLAERLSLFDMNLGPFITALSESFDQKTLSFLRNTLPFDQLFESQPLPRTVIVHGDAHYGNALFSESSSACLIDWGMPMLAFGEVDVAHAIAMNLPAHARRLWEPELHRVYLEGVAAHGLALDEDTFRDRYRLGVLYAFASPVSWWRSGVPERIWRPALANLIGAAADLGLGD